MRRPAPLLSFCLLLSGLGSLALEVVWTRQLRLVFGSTTLAASTILVAYMLGLGLGGLIGGRFAARMRNGIRVYGWLEIGIGIYALLVPMALTALPDIQQAWFSSLGFWAGALVRFGLSLVVLLVPTLLMGATLPVLVAALVRVDPRIGRNTGLLYGVNTVGAVLGVFLTTFFLLPALGLLRSNLLAALLDVGIGAFALLFVSRRLDASLATVEEAPGSIGQEPAVTESLSPAWERVFLIVYALVGYSALVFEVAWTRTLAVVLGSSVYGFSAMLGAFLTGIGLGSLFARRAVDSLRRPVVVFACGVALLGALALGTTMAMPHLPAVFLRAMQELGATSVSVSLVQVTLCMAVMLPPTLVLGALFPLACRILASSPSAAGSAVGRIYFANTLGSATGAFTAGFWLVPVLGLHDTLTGVSALALGLGGVLLLVRGASLPARGAGAASALAAIAVLVLGVPFDRMALTRGVFKDPQSKLDFGLPLFPIEGIPVEELVFYEDGINSTVSVHREMGAFLTLRVNGKADASNHGDMPTQVLLGQIPLLFGPPAKRVLVIGYASGVTAGSAARHAEIERIDAVEIEPAMVEASKQFARENGNSLDDPRLRVILEDARTFIAGKQDEYDVIISEPSNPWMSGVASLFTKEFFQKAHRALGPDGRLLQWVQLYGLEPRALQSILAAIRASFPYVYGFALHKGDVDLLLLATKRPIERSDLPRWEKLTPAVRSDLERIGSFSTYDLWTLLRLLPQNADALSAAAAEPNSDDNLLIEMGSAWMLYEATIDPNWRMLERGAKGVVPLLKQVGEPLGSSELGGLALAYARRGETAVARNLVQQALGQGRSGLALAASAAAGAAGAGAAGEDEGAALQTKIASLEEAIQIDPTAIEPLLMRGEIERGVEMWEEALADADAVLRIDPRESRAQMLRATALTRLGRTKEALAALRPVISSDYVEYDPDGWRLLVELELAEGRLDAAHAVLSHYLHREDSGWVDGWNLLGELEQARGRTAEADAARQNATNTRRNQSILLQRDARRAIAQGDSGRAQQLLRMAVEMDPENRLAEGDLEGLAKAEPRQGS